LHGHDGPVHERWRWKRRGAIALGGAIQVWPAGGAAPRRGDLEGRLEQGTAMSTVRAQRNSHLAGVVVLALALVCGVVPSATATTLTFEVFDSDLGFPYNDPGVPPTEPGYGYRESFQIPGNYGDNVTGVGPVLSVIDPLDPTQLFRYDIGPEGDTPDVTASYGPYSIFTGGPSLWRTGYGDLNGVLYQGSTYPDPNNPVGSDYNVLDVVLVADAGWDVVLHGFDVAGYLDEFTINSVTVYDGVPFPFLTPTNAIGTPATNVMLPAGGHVSFTAADFGVASLTSQIIWMRIDHSNVPDFPQFGALIALDNVRFSQTANASNGPPPIDPDDIFDGVADVPEPASLVLLLLGGGGAALDRVRRRRRSA
jgi:hypothetical protein